MNEGAPSNTAGQEAVEGRRLDHVLSEVPFHALLLAAYPVLLLYGDNVVDVAPSDVVVPLALVLGIAALLLTILARLLGSWPRAGVVVTVTLVPFLLAGLLVDALEASWPDDFPARLHALVVALWLAVAGIGIYVALKLHRYLGTVTRLLNIISVVLLVLAMLPAVGDFRTSGSERDPEDAITASADAAEGSTQRDIYHLIFDRYGSDSSLELSRGIDNSEFTDWLRATGFQVVDDARANFERTALSLSAVHDMSLHEDLMAAETANYDELVDRIRTSRAASTLKASGYDYIVAGSWWGPSAFSPIADLTVKPRYVMSFGSALADRSLLPSLETLAAIVTRRSIDGSERQIASATENQFASLPALSDQPSPKLVFAHFLVPHDPYVFLQDGTVDGANASYETQLAFTNEQLRHVIEDLLAVPEEDQPIIILQADEGPYPERYDQGRDEFDWTTATAEELVTKFGVLNAFYLPGSEGEAALPDGLSLVNTYPEILRRYLGLDIENLDDRVYTMVNGNYFDTIEVTDEVDAAFAELVPN